MARMNRAERRRQEKMDLAHERRALNAISNDELVRTRVNSMEAALVTSAELTTEVMLVLFNHWSGYEHEVWKSKRTADGRFIENGKQFRVFAKLPTGVVNWHFAIAHWDDVRCAIADYHDVPEVDEGGAYVHEGIAALKALREMGKV